MRWNGMEWDNLQLLRPLNIMKNPGAGNPLEVPFRAPVREGASGGIQKNGICKWSGFQI